MKKRFLTFIGIVISYVSHGQVDTVFVEPGISKSLQVDCGINRLKNRDYHSSPLFYQGVLKYVSLSSYKKLHERERILQFSYSSGTVENETNSQLTSRRYSIYDMRYTMLFPLYVMERWAWKLGGTFRNSLHHHDNTSFKNNNIGIVLNSTLFISTKVSADISNTESRQAHVWFLPFNIKPRKREISFGLHLSVMNNALRNKLAGNAIASLTDQNSFSDEYLFRMFSGFRLSTSLDYQVFIESGNAFILGYEFDASTMFQEREQFDVAQHKLKFTLVFKTK